MSSAEERRSARENVIRVATIEAEGVETPVRLSNVSEHGALVIGKGLSASESQVAFRCNGVTIESWVVWVNGKYAGVQFARSIDPAALARTADAPEIMITPDNRVVNCRRPGFRGNQMTKAERRAVEEWLRQQAVA